MRLIDADDPKLYEKTYFPQDWSDTEEYPLMIEWKDIVDAPKVDAEPVRHGKWIDSPISDAVEQCSVCSYMIAWREDGDYYAYCPNCGAKMDGDAEK